MSGLKDWIEYLYVKLMKILGKEISITADFALVEKDGKFLLVKEKSPVARGKWNLPGGRREKGESSRDCAKRETEEETGFEAEIGRQIAAGNEYVNEVLCINYSVYAAKVVGGRLKVPKDLLNVDWFSREEIAEIPAEQMFAAFVKRAVTGEREN